MSGPAPSPGREMGPVRIIRMMRATPAVLAGLSVGQAAGPTRNHENPRQGRGTYKARAGTRQDPGATNDRWPEEFQLLPEEHFREMG
jgi:hypothetical protein